jgi:hypothetical protein
MWLVSMCLGKCSGYALRSLDQCRRQGDQQNKFEPVFSPGELVFVALDDCTVTLALLISYPHATYCSGTQHSDQPEFEATLLWSETS